MDVVYLLPFGTLCAVVGFYFGVRNQRKTVAKAKAFAFRYEEVQRKSDEYFQKIEEVIRERELWRAWYNNQSAGHDNAQSLMMDQIHQLYHAYRAVAGKDYKLNPVIKRVRDQWGAEHGEDARSDKHQQIAEGEEPSDG